MDEKHKKIKKIFKTLGPILLIIGIIFDAIGLINFFMAFANQGVPTMFWCLFIGFPLTGFGIFFTIVGFMREINKYNVDENKDVNRDFANYMMKATRNQMAETVAAMKSKKSEKVCPHCGNIIPSDSSFCPNCGKPLEKICPKCGSLNEDDAKFCKNCGNKLD